MKEFFMSGYYQFKTNAGAFHIVPRGNRWLAMFEGENLGSYATPQHALDELAGGHTDWPDCGDPSECGLPDDIADWTFVRVR